MVCHCVALADLELSVDQAALEPRCLFAVASGGIGITSESWFSTSAVKSRDRVQVVRSKQQVLCYLGSHLTGLNF